MLRSKSNNLLVKKSAIETLNNSKSQQSLPKKPIVPKAQPQIRRAAQSKVIPYEPKPVNNILNQRSSRPMQFRKSLSQDKTNGLRLSKSTKVLEISTKLTTTKNTPSLSPINSSSEKQVKPKRTASQMRSRSMNQLPKFTTKLTNEEYTGFKHTPKQQTDDKAAKLLVSAE